MNRALDWAPVRKSSVSLAAGAFGAVAIGAAAIGALAIGRLVIRRLLVKKASFKSLQIDELTVNRPHVADFNVSNSLSLPAGTALDRRELQ
jgi:hypothetical protein